MTRTGKIARLPRPIRDQLNARLHDGEPGKRLVDWLNSLPEVKAVLKAEFDSRPINEQNLSEWKLGGYRDWLAQQETLQLIKQLSADADELKQALPESLTDQMALWVAARYAHGARALAEDGTSNPDFWPRLRELCNDIVLLRRGDHMAERLKIERERLALARKQAEELTELEHWEWVQSKGIKEQICKPEIPLTERIQRLRRRMFGDVAPFSVPAPSAPASGTNGEPEHQPKGLAPNPMGT